jgi:hypothetical protein
MTEAEWRDCTNPMEMLEFLRAKASDRKLRLFACACCRRVWHLLTDDRNREAVEVAEAFADGRASVAALQAARQAADLAYSLGDDAAACAGVCAERYDLPLPPGVLPTEDYYDAFQGAADAAYSAACALAGKDGAQKAVVEAEYREQAGLLCDLFGPLPFRRVTTNPTWLAWKDGTVVKLAQTIYDDRAFDRLPILADALEGAGCTDQDILHHCRDTGPHVKGCWAVDLLLAKM